MPAILNLLLTPLSWLYKSIALVDWYAKRLRRRSFPALFIISIDNLSFGGSGKTSLVSHIGRLLSDKGIPFAVVSRGYRSTVRSGCRAVDIHDDAASVGDEPLLLKQQFPGCRVMIGPDRLAALHELSQGPIRIVLLDDGFQSAHIGKDFRILLETPGRPGYYYRNFRFMARHSDLRLNQTTVAADFFAHPPAAPAYRFLHQGLHNASQEPVQPGSAPIIAFCALGDNLRFQRDLAPYCVKAFHPFPDHHRYSPRDIETLKKSRADHQAAYCVCTLKDFVKLPPAVQRDSAFLYAKNGIELNFSLWSRLSAIEKFRDYISSSH